MHVCRQIHLYVNCKHIHMLSVNLYIRNINNLNTLPSNVSNHHRLTLTIEKWFNFMYVTLYLNSCNMFNQIPHEHFIAKR